MKVSKKFVLLMVVFSALAFLTACEETEDAAEDALEETTDMDWELNEEDFVDLSGVETPHNWEFLFAVQLDEEQAQLIDQDFEIDLSLLEDLGLSFEDVDQQVIMAHVDTTPAGDPGLRYANKILVRDAAIVLDGESIQKLGASVGSSGPGWYVAYIALEAVGFVKGTVTDCAGNAPTGESVLVLATDGPFFTYAANNGSWALPSLNGKPAAINFDAGDCSGSSDAPVTDEEDPKDPDATPPQDDLEDDTNIVDDGETDLGGDEGVDNPPVGDVSNFDFESGTTDGWYATGDCFGVYSDSYGDLFPGGDEQYYGFITTGGSNWASCTVTRTVQVPDGASELVVSYNFVSQEYAEWINSAYNDIFTIILQGETGYMVHRTINDVAFEDAWTDLSMALGDIASSNDANYNDTGKIFDGQLNWAGSPAETPRGGSDDEIDAGRVATFPVTPGETITILITVSDVADLIYDSAALIDYFEFQ